MTCNKDCLNCQYKDCIRDDKQDARDVRMKYYYSHKELESQRRRQRYRKNADKEKAASKAQYCAIKSDPVAYKEYRERRNAYLRAYRARKKAERA